MIEKIKKIPQDRIPSHVAIIMDGNRRWAKKNNYPIIYGHREGIKIVKKIVKCARSIKIKYLTLYAFSTENWKRTSEEVLGLMSLLKKSIKSYKDELKSNDISLKISGDLSGLSKDVRDVLLMAVKELSNCSSMVLNLALNYGGRKEIVDAVNKCIDDGLKKITEMDISKRLYTSPLPDPDLIIRTSGEYRLSNFLIWQSAYSELYITDVLWPDFSDDDFYKAIIDYSKRERRIGK